MNHGDHPGESTRRGFNYSASWQQLSGAGEYGEHDGVVLGHIRDASRESSGHATPRADKRGGSACHNV